MIFGFADSGEHSLIRCWAVLQQYDLIAYYEWTADDFLFERNLFIQDIDVAGILLEFLHDGRASFSRNRTPCIFEMRCLRNVTLRQELRIEVVRDLFAGNLQY